ncbi:MAG: hypothetical protein ACJA08_000753 [Cyclobacteriaceae bacterium]|jgi:hypothetical protein
MNIKKMRLIYATIILVSIGVIGGALYSLYKDLGGLDTYEIYQLQPIKRIVVGKYFKTMHSDKIIDEHILKCRELIENKKINGELIVVHYVNDSIGAYDIEEFIGISLEEDMAEIPMDFDMREYHSNKRYAVFLSMHPSVRPTTENVETLIMAKSIDLAIELEPFFMEIYFLDNSMSIEGWIK